MDSCPGDIWSLRGGIDCNRRGRHPVTARPVQAFPVANREPLVSQSVWLITLAALKADCHFVGDEVNEEYLKMAEMRILPLR